MEVCYINLEGYNDGLEACDQKAFFKVSRSFLDSLTVKTLAFGYFAFFAIG